jgi:hypothetical protein
MPLLFFGSPAILSRARRSIVEEARTRGFASLSFLRFAFVSAEFLADDQNMSILGFTYFHIMQPQPMASATGFGSNS